MTTPQAIRLIKEFEACTLPKAEWTHEAHFIAAAWYCLNYPLPQAIGHIRNNIKSYNLQVGGLNTDSAGYHETITLFYITQIIQYLTKANISELTDHTIQTILQQPFLDRQYIFDHYTKDRLMSPQARRNWVEPDKHSAIPKTSSSSSPTR